MTDTFTFKTLNCRGGRYILPEPQHVTLPRLDGSGGRSTIDFVNDLTPRANIEIFFYKADEPKDSQSPISNFCDGEGDSLSVNARRTKTCTLTQPAEAYAFTVKTTSGQAHHDLDPVIIIQPTVARADATPSGPGEAAFLIGGFFLGILATLVVGLLLRE